MRRQSGLYIRRERGGSSLTRVLMRSASTVGLCALGALALGQAALATDINTGSTTLASNLTGKSTFNGGTLELDTTDEITNDITVNDVSTNKVDIFGSTVTMSGKLTGTGGITFVDTKGGGNVTLTSNGNTYSGTTTINSGAKVSLGDSGTLTDSALVNNGTFDISDTTAGGAVASLSGSGSVVLGNEYLTMSAATGTFSGVISGTGGVVLSSGTETLTAANTYTGATTITSGTLYLKGAGSIAKSSANVYGTLDITQANANVELTSLYGTGTVSLGARSLTLTSASGSFSGVIQGTGAVILNGGEEYLTGANTFTGGVTVNAGTMHIGTTQIAYNVTNKSGATLDFYSTGTVEMDGVVSGTGLVTVNGGGAVTITTAQAYTGSTTITSGRLTLSGAGSIASSSSVIVDGTFDLSSTSAASIKSLAGTGTVQVGDATLTITNASSSDVFSGSVAGSGTLVLAGGTQTLSGAATFTGTTIVSAGKLVLVSGANFNSARFVDNALLDLSVASSTTVTPNTTIGSLAGSGSVTLGEHNLILADANDTFSGVISGSGGLTVTEGSQTLTGVNTYTGATTISDGTLVLSGAGRISTQSAVAVNGTLDVSAVTASGVTLASLSGTGNVVLGDKDLAIAAGSGTFTGVISGSGGLEISGGTQILAGNNTYIGGTTIAASGTLQIGDNSSFGSITGNVVDNGTLVFARSTSNEFSGVISGSGSLVQDGGGTLILSGDNTYTGGTTIIAGTLQIGNGGTTGSIKGDIKDDGTLAFARTGTTNYAGVISGTGGLSLVSGTLVVTGANTYTGTTAVASGATLVLNGSGSVAGSSGIAVNGTFDVSQAAASGLTVASLAGGGSVVLGSRTLGVTNGAGDFSGVISGMGGLTVSGGTQILSGANTYTGQTIVTGGGLTVDGSISASSGVVVNTGATLAGKGAVPGITVNGGTLSPGEGGAGKLTAHGPVTFAANSTYVVTMAANSVSSLSADGAVHVDGTFAVASVDGTYHLGEKSAVITSDGTVSGSFTVSPIIRSGVRAQYIATVTQDQHNVFVEVDLAKLSTLLPQDVTKNQANVIAGIDVALAADPSKVPAAFQQLGNLTSAQLGSASGQLTGEIGGDLPQVGRFALNTFIGSIFDHLADARRNGGAPQGQPDVWLSGFGGTDRLSASDDGSGMHGFKTSAVGLIAGANWALSPSMTIGGAVSAGRTDFNLVDGDGTGTSTAIQVGIYGLMQFSRHFYGSFAAAASSNSYKTQRQLSVSGADALEGKLTGLTFGGRYETGVTLRLLSPYVAVQDEYSTLPAYSETAASGANTFALHYDSRSVNAGRFEVGVRQDFSVDFTPRWLLTPDGTLHLTDRFAWAHGFGGDSRTNASFVSVDKSDFTFTHANPDTDGGLASLGAELEFVTGFSVNAHVEAALSQKEQSYTGFAGVGYTW